MPKNSTKEGQKFDFGCLMLLVKAAIIPHYAEILAGFKAEDLYESDIPGEFGIEYDPHVTVLYGLHDDGTPGYPNKVLKAPFLSAYKPPISLALAGVSNFHNPKYDVVKFDVKSPALEKMNESFTKHFKYTNDYEYKPHLTLAYVEAGKGPAYCKKIWELLGEKPIKLIGAKLEYSRPNGDKIITSL